MKHTYVISDTHFNHDNMPTYCKRPVNFTEILIKRWQEVVKPEDLVIHLGDVAIGNRRHVKDILAELPGRKVLVLGNHDKQHGPDWWMDQGFSFACEAMKYRGCWLTHAPSPVLPMGCRLNIHGHLHNFTKEVHPDYHAEPFQRLFAVEYTDYRPVNFDKFVAQPDRYKARIHHRGASRFTADKVEFSFNPMVEALHKATRCSCECPVCDFVGTGLPQHCRRSELGCTGRD